MAGVGESYVAIGADTECKTRGKGFTTPQKTPIECIKDREGVGLELSDSSNGAYEQRDKHSCFKSFARHVSCNDEQAAIGGMRNDLKEVTADFEGWAVLALNLEARQHGARFGKDELLDFLCLLHVESHLALASQADHEASQEQQGERNH